jgi:hypothetical protein
MLDVTVASETRGDGMADPVTFSVLGSWAALEGIKFLYSQAAEVVKAWRERRKQKSSAPLEVPVEASAALDGAPGGSVLDTAVLDREGAALASLVGRLSPYAQDLADLDLDDTELAEQAGQLRAILEAAYGQYFTFRGEQRPTTGTRVTVSQTLGQVAGTVVGAEADVSMGTVDVQQQVTTVEAGGAVTGFKGTIGDSGR